MQHQQQLQHQQLQQQLQQQQQQQQQSRLHQRQFPIKLFTYVAQDTTEDSNAYGRNSNSYPVNSDDNNDSQQFTNGFHGNSFNGYPSQTHSLNGFESQTNVLNGYAPQNNGLGISSNSFDAYGSQTNNVFDSTRNNNDKSQSGIDNSNRNIGSSNGLAQSNNWHSTRLETQGTKSFASSSNIGSGGTSTLYFSLINASVFCLLSISVPLLYTMIFSYIRK